MSKIIVRSALVCEYVRAEQGGKYCCMGIYPGGAVAIADFSKTVNLGWYIDIASYEQSETNIQYRLMNLDRREFIFDYQTTLHLNYFETNPIVASNIPLKIPGPTTLVWDVKIGDDVTELARATLTQST